LNMRYRSGSFVDFSRLSITETLYMAQHCGPTAVVAVVSRDRTFAPRTPATSPENNRCVHQSLVWLRRGLVTGACVQVGGKRPEPAPTTADRTESAPRPPCQHTRPSALVDLAGSPCRGVQRLQYRPIFRGHPASSAAAYPLPSANCSKPCPPLNM